MSDATSISSARDRRWLILGVIALAGQIGHDIEAPAHRQEREAGYQRRVAQRLLQIVGQEQEEPEQPGRADEHRGVGAAPVTVEHHAGRQQRVRPGPLGQKRTPPPAHDGITTAQAEASRERAQ
jgi:hypothetical protein